MAFPHTVGRRAAVHCRDSCPYARWTNTDEAGEGAVTGGKDMIKYGEGEDGDGAVAGGEDMTDDGEHGGDDGRPTQG